MRSIICMKSGTKAISCIWCKSKGDSTPHHDLMVTEVWRPVEDRGLGKNSIKALIPADSEPPTSPVLAQHYYLMFQGCGHRIRVQHTNHDLELQGPGMRAVFVNSANPLCEACEKRETRGKAAEEDDISEFWDDFNYQVFHEIVNPYFSRPFVQGPLQ